MTVRDASGAVLYQQATPFLAQDNVYTSVGAIKVGAARPKALAFSGFFLPTAEPTYANGPASIFPDDRNPELALSVWEGDLFPANRPQSVYTLDTTNLTQLTKADGTPLLIRLKPGQTFQLPDGRGSITLRQGRPVRRAVGPGRPGQGAHPGRRDRHDPRPHGLPAGPAAPHLRSGPPDRRPLAYPRHHRWSGADFGPRARCGAGRAAHRAQQRTLGMPSAELVGYSNLALYSAMAVFTVSMLLFAAYLAALGPVAAERGSKRRSRELVAAR